MSKFRDWIGGLLSIVIFLMLVIVTAVFNKFLLNTSFKSYKLNGPTAKLSTVLISQTSESGAGAPAGTPSGRPFRPHCPRYGR